MAYDSQTTLSQTPSSWEKHHAYDLNANLPESSHRGVMQGSSLDYGIPTSMAQSGMTTSTSLPPSNVSAPSMLSTPTYTPTYNAQPPSMATPGSGISDPMSVPENAIGSPRMSPSHHSMSALSAQKRAYRQRRKDPSCDACRERKVKCDATDASSCSECSSRSVKCQFTKETNRRMSSMKQVQDLERQLQQAKSQITQLKGMLQDNGTLSGQAQPIPSLALPEDTPSRERAQAPRPMSNFFKVRRNLRNYGRGVFKPPQAYRTPGVPMLCMDSTIALPPKHVVDQLLAQYRAVIHPFAPVLHWPSFQRECDNLYRTGTFQGQRKVWIAVFFGTLACGTLVLDSSSPHKGNGQTYIEIATRNINTMSDEVMIDHARATLLFSVYFMETNLKSAGWIWLSASVRAAQETGLHCEPGQNSQHMQAEIRRRVWWSIYNWDRLCSLEMGQPPSIADSDVDVGEPTPVDDECIGPNGISTPPLGSTPNTLITYIPVVRIIYQLKKTLKSRSITAATLKIYDDHFNSIMESYPEPFPIASTAPLDPGLLHPALSLHVARFFLYRHNLSVACRPHERQDALHRCVQVGKDTAHYIYRSTPAARTQQPRLAIHPPDASNLEWRSRLRVCASSFLCTHLWRCTLVLCLCGEFAPALTCVAAMAVIGDQKKINTACGRNLAFFLDRLIERIQMGQAAEIRSDEEMLAYASADLQGCHDSAWAWAGSETGASMNNSASDVDGHPGPSSHFSEQASGYGQRSTVLLTKEEEQEWGGWSHVEALLRQLHHGQPGAPQYPTGTGMGAQQADHQQQYQTQHQYKQEQHEQRGPLYQQLPGLAPAAHGQNYYNHSPQSQRGPSPYPMGTHPPPQPPVSSSRSPLPTPSVSAQSNGSSNAGTMGRISIQDII